MTGTSRRAPQERTPHADIAGGPMVRIRFPPGEATHPIIFEGPASLATIDATALGDLSFSFPPRTWHTGSDVLPVRRSHHFPRALCNRFNAKRAIAAGAWFGIAKTELTLISHKT